ncbi:MAG TPA: tetratricopeptide repeat protein, partial [Ferruginibacter sp.]|nr:tetratricopeptide repeat protein [Ferruginibacter sp.]
MYGEYQAANLTGDKKKQIETMEKIAATYPQAPRAQTDLSFAYFGNNEFDKAKAALDKALAMNAKWIPALSGLTTWYLFGNNKDPKKAEENALKVVELAPKSAGAQILLGDAYRAGNDFQKAKDAYAKAVSLDPDSPDGYSKEGNANTYLGNYDEARKNFKDGSTHDNNSSFYVAPTAFTYLYANGDYKTAIKALMDGAGTVDSSNKKAPSQKSSLYTSASMIAFHFNDAAMLKQLTATLAPLSEKADNDLGTAEAKAFAKADALNWQAMVAIADGKYDDAKAKAEEMKTALDPIKDDRKLETYHYLMGQISMKQKNYADAVAHFEKADWTNQIYYKYWLAMANEAAGNKDKAMSLYKEIANYNFNDVGNALVRSEVKKKVATP